jgi:biopolymer transport protein ExbB/TolQ
MTASTLRIIVVIFSALIGVLLVVLLNLLLPGGTVASELLVDKRIENGAPVIRYMATQTFMWIAFMISLGEVILRLYGAHKERAELDKNYLNEDPRVLLSSKDLVPVYQRVASPEGLFLPELIKRTILQFQVSKSVDRSNTLLNSGLDLFMHEIDLRYNFLRFMAWLLPSLGFLGTVVGVVDGLKVAAEQFTANQGNIDLAVVVQSLGVAFYTTWLALIMAAVLLFLMHLAQETEEKALNQSGQYCIANLINKLLENK